MTFGQRLVAARERKGIKQSELADKLGVSKTCINYWEKDKRQPNVIDVKNLCDVLDVSGNELIGTEKAPTRRQGLTKEEETLLTNYHNASPEHQTALWSLAECASKLTDLSDHAETAGRSEGELFAEWADEMTGSPRDIQETVAK